MKKTVLITGSNQGIGYELAKYLCKNGYNLILCARNIVKLANVEKELSIIKKKNQFIISKNLDISSEKKVDNFFKLNFKKLSKVDVLINCAGIYGPKGLFQNQNWQNWKDVIRINLLGSIYIIKKILPYFTKKNKGKIIQFAGGGAASPFPFFTAYSASKVGLVRFIENISLELKDKNIQINCIAPGPVNTRMLDEVLVAGPANVGKSFYEKSIKQKRDGGTDIKKINELVYYLINKDSKNLSGKLISAQWDNWKNFKKRIDEINKSDLGTLRRIAGRDRKMNFFDL